MVATASIQEHAPFVPNEGHPRLSPAAENYLQAIFILEEDDVAPTPGHVADYLRGLAPSEHQGTSLPSVTGMVRRMARQGLVHITPGKEVRLTEEGREMARDVVRRHRLAECLAVTELGVPLERAHQEAHRLEHGLSRLTEQKIARRLGYPSVCPFGHPIPGADQADRSGEMSLAGAESGRRYIVTWIPEHGVELLGYLIAQGVLPGQSVHVAEAAPYRGVMVLRTDGGAEIALGYEAASRIRVREG
jgi:DtxR family Mn-dependent transcriptional regulator